MNTTPPVGAAAPAAPTQQPLLNTNKLSADSGLWVGIALFGGIMLSGTRAAPVVAGLLGVALIYQLQNLLQGK